MAGTSSGAKKGWASRRRVGRRIAGEARARRMREIKMVKYLKSIRGKPKKSLRFGRPSKGWHFTDILG